MFTALQYIAGHLLVTVIAVVFVRMLRREPNLAARRDTIFELNSRPMRVEAGEAELAEARPEAAAVERQIDETQSKIRDQVALDDPPSTRIAYALLTVILAEAESGIFWLLTAPVRFLNLSADAWAFAAPAFSSVWVVVLHMVLSWTVADKHRPARTLRRAKVGAGLGCIAVIVAVWLVLSGRNLSDAGMIEQLASAGLMILAGLTAVTAGFCSVVWTTLLEAQRNEHELVRLERLRKGYVRHIDLVEKDLARLHEPPEPPEASAPVTASTPSPKTLSPATAASAVPPGNISTVFLICLLLVLPVASRAQITTTANTRMTAASRPSALSNARQGACEFLPDITKSEDRTVLQKVLSDVARDLPLIADALRCSVLRISPFGGSLFEGITEIPLSRGNSANSDCGSQASTSTSATGKAVRWLYPTVAAADRQAMTEKCSAQRQQAQRQILEERRGQLRLAATQLEAVGTLKPRGPCTALPQAIQRALRRSQRLVVISDGISTCAPPLAPTTIPPDGYLLFLLIPPGDPGDTNRANTMLDTLAALERYYSGSHALLAPEATNSLWQRLDLEK